MNMFISCRFDWIRIIYEIFIQFSLSLSLFRNLFILNPL